MIPQKAWLDIYSIVLASLLLFATFPRKNSTLSGKFFFRMVQCLFPLLIGDAVLWCLEVNHNLILTKFIFIWIYTFALLFICFLALYLMFFIKENYGIESTYFFVWITPLIFMVFELLWISSMFNGIFYSFTEDGWFVYTKWHVFSQLGAALILTPQYVVIFRNRRRIGSRNVIVWTLYIMVTLVVRYFDLAFNLPLVYPSITLAVLLIYISVNLEMDKKIKDQQMELMDSQQKVMISQIQPHFLYNVLNTIVYLCKKDSAAAAETTVDFATYLRMNLNSMAKEVPVPFETELEHTKTYLKLEKRRFDDVLAIEYDIQSTNFFVPVLTLQPLVENAVKHGICMAEDGGTVTIRSYEDKENFYIEVNDTGAGFDTSKPREDDGRTHIGMANTIRRITSLGGKVDVQSAIGKGTRIKVTLPRKSNNSDLKRV